MITIIGSLNYDLVTYTKRAPAGGETIQGESFEGHLGGKGLNEAIAVARLSSPDIKKSEQIRMWGKLGDDYQGVELLESLKTSGINLGLVDVLKNEKSGTATIIVETESGENRIIIVAGTNGKLKPNDNELSKNFSGLNDDKQFVVLQNEFPNPEYVIGWLSKNKPEVKKFYNPSPLIITPEKLTILNKVEYLIANEIESFELLKSLSNGATLVKQIDEDDESIDALKYGRSLISELRKYLTCPSFIITLGSKGCLFQESSASDIQYQPSCKVSKVIDTTGAGDTFFGGVVSKLHEGKSLKDSIEFATFASSLAIQKKGAVEGIPSYEDVRKAMNN